MRTHQEISQSRELHQQAFDRLWAKACCTEKEDLLILMQAYVLMHDCWVDSVKVLVGLNENEQN